MWAETQINQTTSFANKVYLYFGVYFLIPTKVYYNTLHESHFDIFLTPVSLRVSTIAVICVK